jgi:hypothetical protein
MELTAIAGGHRVATSAAPSLKAWIRRITEIDGEAPAITEIYRSAAEQDRLYDGWINRRPGFNPAYKSTDKRARHIKGLAIDWGFQGRATAHRTAHEFGWTFNVVGEEWHAEKTHATKYDTVAPPELTPEQKDELEMISREAQQFITDAANTAANNAAAVAVAKLADSIRRDSRYRVYRNRETGQFLVVNWDLPTDDPARVIYPNDVDHLRRMYNPYQLVGDSPEQAKVLEPFEFESLKRLADGTDVAYQPK